MRSGLERNQRDQDVGIAQQPKRKIKSTSLIARKGRVENSNAWKPKRALKDRENDPKEAKTEVKTQF